MSCPDCASASGPTAAVEERPYRPYWKVLLLWGVVVELLGFVLLVSALHNADSTFYAVGPQPQDTGPGATAVFGWLIAGAGLFLLLPGAIGWGIHASGLTRSRAPEPKVAVRRGSPPAANDGP